MKTEILLWMFTIRIYNKYCKYTLTRFTNTGKHTKAPLSCKRKSNFCLFTLDRQDLKAEGKQQIDVEITNHKDYLTDRNGGIFFLILKSFPVCAETFIPKLLGNTIFFSLSHTHKTPSTLFFSNIESSMHFHKYGFLLAQLQLTNWTFLRWLFPLP